MLGQHGIEQIRGELLLRTWQSADLLDLLLQVERSDHILTSSHGFNGADGYEYRMGVKALLGQGRMRAAMPREIVDVRRAAVAGGGAQTKYNGAIREMLDYAYGKGYLNK